MGLVEELLEKKAAENNTICLTAYTAGLEDYKAALEEEEEEEEEEAKNKLIGENTEVLETENKYIKRLILRSEVSKLDHEIPNDNHPKYNQGYVKAMNNIINDLKILLTLKN